jgi:hypothetical protein
MDDLLTDPHLTNFAFPAQQKSLGTRAVAERRPTRPSCRPLGPRRARLEAS